MKFNIKVLIAALIVILVYCVAPATQRLVLCEKFTNTGCGPCYDANLLMDQLADTYPEYMAVIRYHVDWPSEDDPFNLFNPAENGARKGYYGISAVPNLHIDGVIDAGSSHSSYWAYISNRYTVESPVEIAIDGNYDMASRTGELNITATATNNITLPGLFLRIALTESNLYYYAPNGLRYHHQTMRYMYPYSLGTRIYLTDVGDMADVDVDFNIYDNDIAIENCELVVFVQSEQNKEVLQAAKISLDALTGIDEETALPQSFQLNQNYPNPFNAGTVIDYQLNEATHVELAVYDMLGRKIKTLVDNNQNAGRYQVKWNGSDENGGSVASGVYYYKLVSADKSESKQMLLVK